MTTSADVPARWTDDCQGKKDYDGRLVSISTRYWPRGGGFSIFNTATREWSGGSNEIRPHAQSAIVLHRGDPGDAEWVDLIEQNFEAETEEEVRAQVEAWAVTQYDRVVRAISREFGKGEG